MADINVAIEDAQPINIKVAEAVNYYVSDVPGPQGEQGPQGNDGVVQSIVAGDNITVDNTDPANPVVSSTGGGGGGASFTGVKARYSSNTTLEIGQHDFICSETIYNEGMTYDTTTGVMTIPADGYYHLIANAANGGVTNNHTARMWFELWKNGERINQLFGSPTPGGTFFTAASVNETIYCLAGETYSLKLQVSNFSALAYGQAGRYAFLQLTKVG